MSKPVCLMSNYDYPGLVHGLEKLGWHVLAGPERNWYAWAKSWSGEHDGRQVTVNKGSPYDFSIAFRREVSQHEPKLIIIGKGLDSNIPADCKPRYWHVLPDDLRYARNRGAIIIYLTLDDPNDFGFFTHTSMPDNVDAIGTCCIETKTPYRSHTRASVFEFWPAWDPAARKVEKRERYACQLAIVGSPYTSQAERADDNPMGPSLSRREVALAALEAGVDVKIWGPDGWTTREGGGHEDLAGVYQGPVAGHEVHNVFATADASYNSFVRYARRYVNDRIFFIMGAGGFMLSERQLMLERSFPEAEWHRRGDTRDFLDKLTYWLDHADERRERAEAGRARIMELHTYAHRADLIHAQFLAARERRRKDNSCCGGKDAMP